MKTKQELREQLALQEIIIKNALEQAWIDEVIDTDMLQSIDMSEKEWKADKLIEWSEPQ